MFSQPNSHSTQRALSPLPSTAHIACALRWKLNDSRCKIAAVEPLPSQRHIHGCLCAHAAAPGAAPPLPPPTAQIAVSRPPSTPHRPLRPHARAPSICPSRASAFSALLGRFPPIPLTCAQVRNGTIYLKLT